MFLRGFLAGMFFVLVGIAAVGMFAKALSQTYLVATLTSFHFDRSKQYNESNGGIGLEQRFNERWAVSAGFFRNSFDRHTNYIFAGYTPFQVSDWRVGAVMGGVTGYENGVSPWLTGIATRDYGRIGLNVVFSAAGIALQVKLKLGHD